MRKTHETREAHRARLPPLDLLLGFEAALPSARGGHQYLPTETCPLTRSAAARVELVRAERAPSVVASFPERVTATPVLDVPPLGAGCQGVRVVGARLGR